MNRDQRKHIKERLLELYREKRSKLYDNEPKPLPVQRAEKLVAQWNAAQNKRHDKNKERLSKAYNQAHECLLFDDAKNALAELRRFEQFNVNG